MTRSGTQRTGSTLLELLVVAAVIAVVTAGARPMLQRVQKLSPDDEALRTVMEARRDAIRSGEVRRLVVPAANGAVLMILARPDGRVIGAESKGVDQLTGRSPAGGSRER